MKDTPSAEARQETEVVYVCSPDWQHYLFTSLRSLLASGTRFDRVVIYCVGRPPRTWRFRDPRITVEAVAPIVEGYFLSNKIYVTHRPTHRVIFLDADTLVLQPLEELYRGVEADFLGRVAGQYVDNGWPRQKWEAAVQSVGGSPMPYFNSGVTVFQNGAQRRLRDLWPQFIERLLGGDLFELDGPRFAEQLALSLAIGAAGLSWHELDSRQHAYAWRNEPHNGAVVFHTSGPPFLPKATAIEREIGIAGLDLPEFRGPAFNAVKLHRRLRHWKAALRALVGR